MDALLERGVQLAGAIFRMAAHRRAHEFYKSLLVPAQARSLFIISEATSPKGQVPAAFAQLIGLIALGADRAVAAAKAWVEVSRDYRRAPRIGEGLNAGRLGALYARPG